MTISLTRFLTFQDILLKDRLLSLVNYTKPVSTRQSTYFHHYLRLMGSCIGAKTTREDHKSVSDQMYAAYAQGRELRGLVAIVGEDALNERDKQLLDFSGVFEDKFLRQSRDEDRSIDETLDLCWTLMSDIDTKYLVRLDQKWIEKYHLDNRE